HPQPPEVALLAAAADEGVLQRGVDRLFRGAIQLALVGVIALRQTKQLLALGAPDCPSLYPRHLFTPLQRQSRIWNSEFGIRTAPITNSKFKFPKFLIAGSPLYGSIRASLAASPSATVVVPRSRRFRLRVLLLRMCCLNALPRRNFPFLVRLNRFAAPRCVLSFNFFGIVVPTLSSSPAWPQPASPCRRRSAGGGGGWCACGCPPSSGAFGRWRRPRAPARAARESAGRSPGAPSRGRGRRSSPSPCRRPRGSARCASS